MQNSFVDDFFVLNNQKPNQKKIKHNQERKLLKSLDLKQRSYFHPFKQPKLNSQIQNLNKPDILFNKNLNSNLSNYQITQKSNQNCQLFKRKKGKSILDSYVSSNICQSKKQSKKSYRTLSYQQQGFQRQESLIHNLNTKFRRLKDAKEKNSLQNSQIKYQKGNNRVQNAKRQLKSLQKKSINKRQYKKQEEIRIHKIKSTQNISQVMQRQRKKRNKHEDQFNENKKMEQNRFELPLNQFCDQNIQTYDKNDDILQNQAIKQKIKRKKRNLKVDQRLSRFWNEYHILKQQFIEIINQKEKYQIQCKNTINNRKKIKQKMKATSTKIIERVINRQLNHVKQQVYFKLSKA